jgi:hypothetical protein
MATIRKRLNKWQALIERQVFAKADKATVFERALWYFGSSAINRSTISKLRVQTAKSGFSTT